MIVSKIISRKISISDVELIFVQHVYQNFKVSVKLYLARGP